MLKSVRFPIGRVRMYENHWPSAGTPHLRRWAHPAGQHAEVEHHTCGAKTILLRKNAMLEHNTCGAGTILLDKNAMLEHHTCGA